MATDKREAILARLLVIAEGMSEFKTRTRNTMAPSDTQRPAIQILDADETADDGIDGRGRPSNTPNLVGMNPEIYILDGSKPETVGPEINAIRAAFIKAVFADTILADLLGTNGGIRYEGCATGLARGRTMEGEMGVSLTFTYVFNPQNP